MSSFICDSTHFNSVQEGLFNLIGFDKDFYCYELEKDFPILFEGSKQLNETIEKELKSLIDELRLLNVVCTSLKYRDNYENIDKEIEDQKKVVYDSKEFRNLNKIGLYKALQCIHYQIETEYLEDLGGMKDKQKHAYNFLEIMIDSLAHYIVRELQAYENERWSIE